MKFNGDMMDNLRLTVLVVTYNHKEYIEQCLNSILMQKTKFDFIVKIVDDCSTDGTSDIVKKYKEKYPDKINVVIRGQNLGVLSSVYPELCDISTPYLYIIDGDDYILDENKFQIQIDVLDKHPECTICTHKVKFVDLKQNSTYSLPNKPEKDSIFDIYQAPFCQTSSHMCRNIIDFANEDKQIVWDVFRFYKLLSLGKLYYINKTMSVYNRTGLGMDSARDDEKALFDHMKMMYALDVFFKFKYTKLFRKSYLPELALRVNMNKFNWKIPKWCRFVQKLLTKSL